MPVQGLGQGNNHAVCSYAVRTLFMMPGYPCTEGVGNF